MRQDQEDDIIVNENNITYLQQLKNILTNKPSKKIYRILLLLLLGLVFNNTNSSNVTNLLADTLKQNLCQNATMRTII